MSEQFDFVTIGAGHNGLIASAYLAAAGKKVAVLERNAWFGGGVVTRELTLPGFRHDQHSMAHIFIQANPLLKNDELGLKSRFGLQYIVPELPMMSVFADGRTLGLYRDRERTCAEIAKFSQRDADAYRWLANKAAEYMPMVTASLYTAPTPLGATYALMTPMQFSAPNSWPTTSSTRSRMTTTPSSRRPAPTWPIVFLL